MNCKQVNDIAVVKRLKILLSFIISVFFMSTGDLKFEICRMYLGDRNMLKMCQLEKKRGGGRGGGE